MPYDLTKPLVIGISSRALFNLEQENMIFHQIRIAFDGDAVLFGSDSERIYQQQGLDAFAEHERAIKTLREWGVRVDEAFFLGGVSKKEILSAFGAHIFFDDQYAHAAPASEVVPSAVVPYREGDNPGVSLDSSATN